MVRKMLSKMSRGSRKPHGEGGEEQGFSLARLSIQRPIFVTCLVLLLLIVGYLSYTGLGLDLFPDIDIPVVTVTVPYRGAGPAEVETLVVKPLEEQLSTIGGLKRLMSTCNEGVGNVTCQFYMETDIKYAEQQVRDKVQAARVLMPKEIDEPVIRRIALSDIPIVSMDLIADLPPGQAYDLAHEDLEPMLEQIQGVGLVNLLGGRQREIQVLLDRRALKEHELSAGRVLSSIADNSQNVPVGDVEEGGKEKSFRTLGQYSSVSKIADVVVNFFGGDRPVRVRDLGTVVDGLKDAQSYSYFNGKPALQFDLYKESGTNTVAVAQAIRDKLDFINGQIAGEPGHPRLEMVRDDSDWIVKSVEDVKETIAIGILLVVLVVYFFLGNVRSMVITAMALPDSLLGAFILMKLAGYTINMMTLMALSLAVGLLIDDAIVVRENIFRHIEQGLPPVKAALVGAREVTLAVIATSAVVISVFLPVGFLGGTVGKFLSQFGLTMCFIMAISLFDALTIAPMLSAYFAGKHEGVDKATPAMLAGLGLAGALGVGVVGGLIGGKSGFAVGAVVGASIGLLAPSGLPAFHRLELWLGRRYQDTLAWVLGHRLVTLGSAGAIFIASLLLLGQIGFTFMPNSDNPQLVVKLQLPPGTSLQGMDAVARQVEEVVRKNPEVKLTSTTVGDANGAPNVATIFAVLVDASQRHIGSQDFKAVVRGELKPFAFADPQVGDLDVVGGTTAPYNLVLKGEDLAQLDALAAKVMPLLAKVPGLVDLDVSDKGGKPEFQVQMDPLKAGRLGVSTVQAGQELRTLTDGTVAGKFRQEGREYDIRVRLQEGQRDLQAGYDSTYVPNINNNLIRLTSVSQGVAGTGPSTITRQDRSRDVAVTAQFAPGAALGGILDQSRKIMESAKLPAGVHYEFIGQAEDFKDMGKSMGEAFLLAFCMMFLVLSSLYESFITPLAILVALPFALTGAFVALFGVSWLSNHGLFSALHRAHLFYVDKLDGSLNLFSMIGLVLLMGLVAKNSILLVDLTMQLIRKGVDRKQAILQAGATRLRPILMTSTALVLGTLPLALAFSEAGRFRSSMGVAIVGGLISSTLLTLVVVPAVFEYVDDFRIWVEGGVKRLGGVGDAASELKSAESAPGTRKKAKA